MSPGRPATRLRSGHAARRPVPSPDAGSRRSRPWSATGENGHGKRDAHGIENTRGIRSVVALRGQREVGQPELLGQRGRCSCANELAGHAGELGARDQRGTLQHVHVGNCRRQRERVAHTHRRTQRASNQAVNAVARHTDVALGADQVVVSLCHGDARLDDVEPCHGAALESRLGLREEIRRATAALLEDFGVAVGDKQRVVRARGLRSELLASTRGVQLRYADAGVGRGVAQPELVRERAPGSRMRHSWERRRTGESPAGCWCRT